MVIITYILMYIVLQCAQRSIIDTILYILYAIKLTSINGLYLSIKEIYLYYIFCGHTCAAQQA